MNILKKTFAASLAALGSIVFGAAAQAQECYSECYIDIGPIDICSIVPEACQPPPPVTPPPPEQSLGKSFLAPGETLLPNMYMLSPNGEYKLSMQLDGNLVLYRLADGYVPWASWTQNSPGLKAVMQHDGNFVIYDSFGNVRWASWTQGTANANLSLQNDGNLVIYGQQAIWASGSQLGDCGITLPTNGNRSALQSRSSTMPRIYGNQYYGGITPVGDKTGIEELWMGQRLTSPNGCYSLVFQTDFNVVLYRNTDGYVPWATWSQGRGSVPAQYATGSIFGPYPFAYPTQRMLVQGDGNVVLYGNATHVVPWATNTPNGTGKILIMQNDGNLVLYTDIVAIWAKGHRYNYAPSNSGSSWPSWLPNCVGIGISFNFGTNSWGPSGGC